MGAHRMENWEWGGGEALSWKRRSTAFLMRVTYDFMRLRQHTFVWRLPNILRGLGRIWLSGRLRQVTVFSASVTFICYMLICE